MVVENYTTQIQGVVNIIWYIVIGVSLLFIVIYFLYKMYQDLTYNYYVDVYKKVGDAVVQFEDKAKQVKLEGSYMFHYKNLKSYSPVIDPKYHRLKQKNMLFGLWKKTQLSFSIFQHGVSLFPVSLSENPGLVPINLDQFNYMQQRIKAIQAKYMKTNVWVQMMPYLAVGGIIIMFIVGMIFYTKHVETIANSILNTVQYSTDIAQQNVGKIQVIPGG